MASDIPTSNPPASIPNDEEEEEEEEEEDPEASMAAFMGFSSFGTQPTSKKRKYNPSTDAFTSASDHSPVDRGGKRGKGSGGNLIPLGKSRVLGASAGTSASAEDGELGLQVGQKLVDGGKNPDEIDLDDGDEAEGGGDIGGENVGLGLKKEIFNSVIEDKNLTSPRRAELNEIQRQIDAITTRTMYISQSPPPNPPTKTSPIPSLIPSSTIPLQLPPPKSDLPFASNTLAEPFATTDTQSNQRFASGRQGQGGNGNGGRFNGERNELWYVNYFDPSFLRNPWEELERERGWVARGSW